MINGNDGFEHLDEGIRFELHPEGMVSIWYRPEDIPSRLHSREAPDTLCGHVAYEAISEGRWKSRTDSLVLSPADVSKLIAPWSEQRVAGRALSTVKRDAYQQLMTQCESAQVALPLAADLRLTGEEIIRASGANIIGIRSSPSDEWARLVVMDPDEECLFAKLTYSTQDMHGILLFEPCHCTQLFWFATPT